MAKLVKQTVRVTKQHNEESMHLLRLMGVPVVQVRSKTTRELAVPWDLHAQSATQHLYGKSRRCESS